MGLRWRLILFAFPSAAVAASSACVYPATEIEIRIASEGICTSPRASTGAYQGRVTIFVGEDLSLVRAEVPTCDGGRARMELGDPVGSLVLTPSGARDAEVSLEIVEGEGCVGSDGRRIGGRDCVLARHVVRFRRNERVDVPVILREECRNDPCAPGTTCVAGRQCVPASCIGIACGGDAAVPPPPPPPVDASTPDGIAPPPDASLDSATDAPDFDPTCGESGVKCPALPCSAGTRCCGQSGAAYTCTVTCPGATNLRLACDDGRDCPTGNLCCLRNTAGTYVSSCETSCAAGSVMCAPTCGGGLSSCEAGVCASATCGGQIMNLCGGVCPQ